MAGTARRVMRLLEQCGLESGEDPLAADDPLLAEVWRSMQLRVKTLT